LLKEVCFRNWSCSVLPDENSLC